MSNDIQHHRTSSRPTLLSSVFWVWFYDSTSLFTLSPSLGSSLVLFRGLEGFAGVGYCWFLACFERPSNSSTVSIQKLESQANSTAVQPVPQVPNEKRRM